MKIFIKFVFVAFTFAGFAAYAEGNCPPGYAPIGGGNSGYQGCAPMSGAGAKNLGGGANTKNGHWVTSYGALAFGKDANGANVFGYGNKRPNQEQADILALKYCEIAKYTDCKIAVQFSNKFVAIVRDENGQLYSGTHKEDKYAAKEAWEKCDKNKAKQCKIINIIDSSPSWSY